VIQFISEIQACASTNSGFITDRSAHCHPTQAALKLRQTI
jgi:hypothetical protein